mmetsp:Transcript_27308/g.63381  ORF Transcript_27308/g.63381 Transcript_27308/m.63381 type:complete len:240 (-) Transcript_27308:24-743(-)
MPPRRKSSLGGKAPSPKTSGRKRSASPAPRPKSTPKSAKKAKRSEDSALSKLATEGVSALSTSAFYASAVNDAASALPRSIASPAARLMGSSSRSDAAPPPAYANGDSGGAGAGRKRGASVTEPRRAGRQDKGGGIGDVIAKFAVVDTVFLWIFAAVVVGFAAVFLFPGITGAAKASPPPPSPSSASSSYLPESFSSLFGFAASKPKPPPKASTWWPFSSPSPAATKGKAAGKSKGYLY